MSIIKPYMRWLKFLNFFQRGTYNDTETKNNGSVTGIEENYNNSILERKCETDPRMVTPVEPDRRSQSTMNFDDSVSEMQSLSSNSVSKVSSRESVCDDEGDRGSAKSKSLSLNYNTDENNSED